MIGKASQRWISKGTDTHTHKGLEGDLIIDQIRDREDQGESMGQTQKRKRYMVGRHLPAAPVGMNNGRQT